MVSITIRKTGRGIRVAICGLLLSMGMGAASAEGLAGLASSQSNRVRIHIEENWGVEIDEYIKVFVGYAACGYDFIVEDDLNNVADTTLKTMVDEALLLMQETANPETESISEEGMSYAAHLMVFTIAGMKSTPVTEAYMEVFDGTENKCAHFAEAHQAIYERQVQKFLNK